MTTKNNIPKGYKDSAVGIIPEEWEVKSVKDFGMVITGNTPSTTDISNYGDKYMFVSPADLSDNKKYILHSEKMLSSKGYAASRKIPKGAILYTCIGSTIGKIGIASCELTSNQQINAIICNETNEYLYYALLFITDKIKILANEQAVPIINKSDFERIKLAIPPLEEQKKIAEILSTWDEAIEKQSKLIEKLELRKRGIMQRLLTGRTRLPGFTTPWQKVKLGDICSITTGKLDANAMNNNGIYPFFTCAKEVYKINQFAFDTEALLISGNGEHLGYVHYYKGKFNAYQRTYVLNNFTQDIFYMFYTLKQNLPKRILQTKSSSNTPYIIMETLTNMEIILPDNQEQKSIANTLTTIDEEINIQVKKLETFRTQKRGLMQQLLTGKIRTKYNII